jgi:hypothetical protein
MCKRLVAALLILALSSTVALAHPGRTAPGSVRRPAAQGFDAHPCCHTHLAQQLDITPPAPANMPCGSQHSCCLRPNPADSSNVPALTGLPRLGLHRSVGPPVSANQIGSRTVAAFCRTDFHPYAALSTVLRISDANNPRHQIMPVASSPERLRPGTPYLEEPNS